MSSSDVESAALQRMLKYDEKAWARSRAKDYGSLDFVATKAYEFLLCQQRLQDLDHNSLNSDRKRHIQEKTDEIMKDIALSPRKKYGQANGTGDHSESLYDVN